MINLKKRIILNTLAQLFRDEAIGIGYAQEDNGIELTVEGNVFFSGVINSEKNGAHKQFTEAAEALLYEDIK